jgi:transposase
MSKKRSRRHYTTEQKAEILRRHLSDKVPVSELCNELGLQPSVFYQWQRLVHENLASALTTPASAGPSRREKELAAKVAQLEAKLAKKDAVIAEIAAEYTQLKKELGEP